jgi:hypothetical protein
MNMGFIRYLSPAAILLSCLVQPEMARPAAAEDNMLAWCVKAYPGKLDWCRRQYPGELPAGFTETPAPQAPAKPVSSFETMMPRLARRSDSAVPKIAATSRGHFASRASDIVAAMPKALAYADIQFDWDGDCNEQTNVPDRGNYLDCSIDGKNSSLTVTATQPTPGNTTDRVEVVQVVEGSENTKKALFELGIIVDAFSRMLDPELSDDQRAGLFRAAAESYFASGRKEGAALGKQARYTITEDGGNVTVTVTPVAADPNRKIPEIAASPVLAMATGLDRSELIKPDPLDAPEIKAGVAERRTMVRSLLAELDRFRYESRFHAVGFMENQPYRGWYERVSKLQRVDGNTLLREACIHAGVFTAAGSLYNLALDYMHSDGKDTPETRVWRQDVTTFLNK